MILAIDIGGSFIKAGIFNRKEKKFLKKEKFRTFLKKEKFLKEIQLIVNSFLKNYKFNKIGIGFPGNISNTGEIIFSPNLPFLKYVNINEFFNFKDFEVRFENDANCAALGAFYFYHSFSDILAITLGTGIGGGIILNGKLLKNSRDIGFEFGHITVLPDGEICSCGKRGCMEAYSSSAGMIRRFGRKELTDFTKLLKIADNGGNLAKKVIEEGFYYLGVGISNLVNIFAPEVVVFTGGVSHAFNEFKEHFNSSFKKFTLKFLYEKTIIKINYNNDLGLLGAANLFN